jgi:hypothetical protein
VSSPLGQICSAIPPRLLPRFSSVSIGVARAVHVAPPGRQRRARVKSPPVHFVSRSNEGHRIRGFHLKTLLVNRAVMPRHSIVRFESVVGPPWAQWWMW